MPALAAALAVLVRRPTVRRCRRYYDGEWSTQALARPTCSKHASDHLGSADTAPAHTSEIMRAILRSRSCLRNIDFPSSGPCSNAN